MTRLPAPLLVSLLFAFCPPLRAADALPDGLYAEITTPRGVVTCELLFRKTPLTVASFVGLAEGTLGPAPRKPFFDGLTLHRVVPGFVVQGGDPLGTGDGGPGYSFPDEFAPGLRHDTTGVLSMANDGPDTNGSQFFLTLRETNRLNYLHSVFGRTVRGLDVLPQIAPGDRMTVKIIRVGAAARAFRADDAAFAALAARAKKYQGAAEPGPAAHFDDPDKLLPLDPPRARNFNFKLANFERATGVKIAARLFAKSPPPGEDARPGAYMRALAEKLGVAQRGAVAAYFAADDDWRVWIGGESTSAFFGRAAAPRDLVEGGAFHAVKEAFLSAARAAGDAGFAQQQKSAASDKAPPPAQRLKLQTDAVLDGLIHNLEPKS
ncbi:MAG: peptidylprolyl isomerase [Verrucomicrobia bacterium]|nr:peptidylprolyl isomerase [Verrucomicrobiota bacterium]